MNKKIDTSGAFQDLTSPEAQKLLSDRAKSLSAVKKEKDERKYEQYLRFQLGTEEQYGIPYHYLKETLHSKQITRVSSAPDFIRGVINWRSKILAIMDVKKIFDIKYEDAEATPWVIVVQNKTTVMGILADEVIGDEWYIPSELSDPMPLSTDISSKYVIGVYQGRVAMLNMDAILNYNTGMD